MSKNTFPTASTLTRAIVLATPAGSVTVSAPSFGVEADSTVGNVAPPSVESEILTALTPTGAAFVPATFQVTFSGPPGVGGGLRVGDAERPGRRRQRELDVVVADAAAGRPPVTRGEPEVQLPGRVGGRRQELRVALAQRPGRSRRSADPA